MVGCGGRNNQDCSRLRLELDIAPPIQRPPQRKQEQKVAKKEERKDKKEEKEHLVLIKRRRGRRMDGGSIDPSIAETGDRR